MSDSSMNNTFKQQFQQDVVEGKFVPQKQAYQMLKTMEKADDRYRWYLCTEEKPTHWVCVQNDIYTALNSYKTNPNSTKSTTVLPVSKFIPPIFDNMIVKHNLYNIISVSVKRS